MIIRNLKLKIMSKKLTKINQVRLHYKRPHISKLIELNSIKKAVNKLRSVIDKDTLDVKEYSWVLLLTADKKLLGIAELSSGSITKSDINMREILQLALLANAVWVILVHNHPSGDVRPSNQDIRVTKMFQDTAALLDVHLLDHVILTSESYFSMLGNELIK